MMMNEINLKFSVYLYTNASVFVEKLIIIQFKSFFAVNLFDIDFETSTIEIFILYDFYALSFFRRRYFTYKRKLYVLITFLMKYDYLCKHFYFSIVIHIDHRFIIHFLNFDMHEKIYDHWIDQLRCLNIDIRYISKFKNKIANVFSKTIFDEKCINIEFVKILQNNLITQKSLWIWKNEKNDYEKFLSFFIDKFEVVNQKILNEFFVFILNVLIIAIDISTQIHKNDSVKSSWKEIYKTSI